MNDDLLLRIDPHPAPRQVQRDKWKPSKAVAAYRAWRDELRARFNRECGEIRAWSEVGIVFNIPTPVSWSKRRREAADATLHMSTPDLDNLIKGFLDGVYYNAETDDRTVASIFARKFWTARHGSIIVWNIGGRSRAAFHGRPFDITTSSESPSPPQDC